MCRTLCPALPFGHQCAGDGPVAEEIVRGYGPQCVEPSRLLLFTGGPDGSYGVTGRHLTPGEGCRRLLGLPAAPLEIARRLLPRGATGLWPRKRV